MMRLIRQFFEKLRKGRKTSKDRELDCLYDALRRPSYETIISHIAINNGSLWTPSDVIDILADAEIIDPGQERRSTYYEYLRDNNWTLGELIDESKRRRHRKDL